MVLTLLLAFQAFDVSEKEAENELSKQRHDCPLFLFKKKFHLACQSYLISFPPQFDPPSKYFKDNTAFSISPSS